MPPIEVPEALARRFGVRPGVDTMNRYTVLRGFCLGNGVDARPGDVVALPARIARGWVITGRLALEAAPAPTAPPAVEGLNDGDPELENADPPARRRRASRAAEGE